MAAGLGFKTFTTGEVLTAADTNGYLMQGINVFASTAARDAAITSPQEGQFAFTKDTNGLWYYDGAAWVASGATGDIEGVTAGTGISGGGTSGTVTITNSMATAIDAKGDLIGGTGADAFDRLAVGTDGQILVADSTASTGLKWATPSSGSLTLISTTTFTSVSGVSTDSLFSSTYDNYVIYFNISAVGAGSTDILVKLRSGGADNSTADYTSQTSYMQNGSLFTTYASASNGGFKLIQNIAAGSSATIQLYSPNLTTTKSGQILGQGTAEASNRMSFGSWYKPSATQFTGISFLSGINITGTFSVYGLAK